MKHFIYILPFLLSFFGVQAEVPYPLEPLTEYRQNTKGFSYSSFKESMQWRRSETPSEFLEDKDVKAVEQNFIRFCQNFDQLSKPDYSAPPKQHSIPPIIHFIWLGSEVPAKVKSAYDSWSKYHPGWEIRLWTDKELAQFCWSDPHVRSAFEQAVTWAEKADILRIDILYQFGGIYSDADVVCLNSFHDLIVQDIGFFSCFELNYIGKHYGEPFFVGSAVMGAAKNSHVMKYCLDHLQTDQEAPNVGIIKRTGPGLISRACQEMLKTKAENILILPCSYLYPLPWKQKESAITCVQQYVSPESLAIHLWDGSWCPKIEKKMKK